MLHGIYDLLRLRHQIAIESSINRSPKKNAFSLICEIKCDHFVQSRNSGRESYLLLCNWKMGVEVVVDMRCHGFTKPLCTNWSLIIGDVTFFEYGLRYLLVTY